MQLQDLTVPTAILRLNGPAVDELLDAPWPVFEPLHTSSQPRWRIIVRALPRARAIARCQRHGVPLRSVARALLWLDTAAALGVVELRDEAGAPSPLTSLLTGLGRMRRRIVRPPERRTIVLPMVAQDRAAQIGDALDSVASLCDRMVVLDGGSFDDTVEVARAHGATVYGRPYDDYLPQRAAAVRLAGHADWYLRLDSDEVVDPALLGPLRAVADALRVDIVEVPFLDLEPDGAQRSPRRSLSLLQSPRVRWRGYVHQRHRFGRYVQLPLSGPCVLQTKAELDRSRSALLYWEMGVYEGVPSAAVEGWRALVSGSGGGAGAPAPGAVGVDGSLPVERTVVLVRGGGDELVAAPPGTAVHVLPRALENSWSELLRRAWERRGPLLLAHRRGVGWADLVRFVDWLDTAATLDVRRILDASGQPSPLTRALAPLDRLRERLLDAPDGPAGPVARRRPSTSLGEVVDALRTHSRAAVVEVPSIDHTDGAITFRRIELEGADRRGTVQVPCNLPGAGSAGGA